MMKIVAVLAFVALFATIATSHHITQVTFTTNCDQACATNATNGLKNVTANAGECVKLTNPCGTSEWPYVFVNVTGTQYTFTNFGTNATSQCNGTAVEAFPAAECNANCTEGGNGAFSGFSGVVSCVALEDSSSASTVAASLVAVVVALVAALL
ncbi:hypothetical protein DFA_00348 [Cavenderia fasciculata]|uniref:Transmembrane protein n=1 Tax=Cavenderia fasciculata TaxID=261658 RepID=F4PRD5_CACFS|nr:uncharacterized protein DFA_00348 [Cavenderia fasciculata]EGG20487.1 hypothetical protein DFA_00348 [Cavenderia fasciculata]|eukprot:XP_004358337.1 hypothetical protein DFA_00348 [Cavenderia fasciculata]